MEENERWIIENFFTGDIEVICNSREAVELVKRLVMSGHNFKVKYERKTESMGWV